MNTDPTLMSDFERAAWHVLFFGSHGPSVDYFYLQPDATFFYLRPDGTSFYVRP